MSRWFKECGVSIASELQMRKKAQEVVGDIEVSVEGWQGGQVDAIWAHPRVVGQGGTATGAKPQAV